MREYEFSARSESAAEDMNRILRNAPFDTDDVQAIDVRVVVDDDFIQDLGIWMAENDEEQPIEKGPVTEKAYEQPNSTGRTGTENPYCGTKREGAVMPDTKRAEILRAVDGEWLTTGEIREAVDIENKKLISSTLSTFFRKHGYVERRGEPPREYTLSDSGRKALKKGRRVLQEADS